MGACRGAVVVWGLSPAAPVTAAVLPVDSCKCPHVLTKRSCCLSEYQLSEEIDAKQLVGVHVKVLCCSQS